MSGTSCPPGARFTQKTQPALAQPEDSSLLSLSLRSLYPRGKAVCSAAQPYAQAMPHFPFCPQIVSSASTDLQDYTYYFVPAPWLSVKLLRLLQCYPPPGTTDSIGLGSGTLSPLLGQVGGCWVFVSRYF